MIKKGNETMNEQSLMLSYFNWVMQNTLGKDRTRLDAMAYSPALNGNAIVFHTESDALKNLTDIDLNIYYAPKQSDTALFLNFERLLAGSYMPVSSFREFKCGTKLANTATVVANVGNPVTAQTLTLTVANATYHVVTVPTNLASRVTITGGSIVKNTAIDAVGGLPKGVTSFLILSSSTTAVLTFTAALGVGLSVGNNSQVTVYPVTLWNANELAIIQAEESE